MGYGCTRAYSCRQDLDSGRPATPLRATSTIVLVDEIAKRIQEILDARAITARELARRAELNERHVSKILERGGARTAGTTLAKIAAGGAVHLEWLQRGVGDRDLPAEVHVSKGDAFPERSAALAPFRDSTDPAHQHAIKFLTGGNKGTQGWNRERWTKEFLRAAEDYRQDEADPSRREAAAARSDATLREHLDAPTVADAVARERKNRR